MRRNSGNSKWGSWASTLETSQTSRLISPTSWPHLLGPPGPYDTCAEPTWTPRPSPESIAPPSDHALNIAVWSTTASLPKSSPGISNASKPLASGLLLVGDTRMLICFGFLACKHLRREEGKPLKNSRRRPTSLKDTESVGSLSGTLTNTHFGIGGRSRKEKPNTTDWWRRRFIAWENSLMTWHKAGTYRNWKTSARTAFNASLPEIPIAATVSVFRFVFLFLLLLNMRYI